MMYYRGPEQTMSQFIHRFHKAIIIMALVLTAISIMAALRLRLNLSLFSLLPSGRPEVQRFFEITEEVGFQSLLISVITVDETLDDAYHHRIHGNPG